MMNNSVDLLDETAVTSMPTDETQSLPPYWSGKEFYTLGLLLNEANQTGSICTDLSEHDFSQPRTIWILIGDALLKDLKQIQIKLHKKSRVLVMVHPEVLEKVDWHSLRFLTFMIVSFSYHCKK